MPCAHSEESGLLIQCTTCTRKWLSNDLRNKGRALTPNEKRQVIERLYAVWLAMPTLRLGQLVMGVAHTVGRSDPFYVEDRALVEAAEDFAKRK